MTDLVDKREVEKQRLVSEMVDRETARSQAEDFWRGRVSAAQEQIDTDPETQPELDAPTIEDFESAYAARKSDGGRLQTLSEFGIDIDELGDDVSWADLRSHVERSLTKSAKQSNVSAAATVGKSGLPAVSADPEAIIAQMNDLYSGKSGSLSHPKNQAKLKELAAKLDEVI